MIPLLTRRSLIVGAAAAVAFPHLSTAQQARLPFERWVEEFRAKARAKGISDATYNRVMAGLKPDRSVYALQSAQPEFREQTWQYLNRRVSDWRIVTGRQKLKEYGSLLARIEKDYGVDRYLLLALWGVESAYGDPLVQKNHMRPVFPALAALAWGEPRRRTYWERELINAMQIVQRGWGTPADMRGSWAGAMGHTQWMPEVWLNVGLDYDRDGRVSPFGSPADALASSASYLLKRGRYRRGERWGFEVTGVKAPFSAERPYAAWQAAGVTRANGEPYPQPRARGRLLVPVNGGPAFLVGPNFYSVRSYNPSTNYVLAIAHLSDRLRGEGPLVKPFPNSERTPTLAEITEIQDRLTKAGFDTGGVDGRVGGMTMKAVRDFQRKVGLEPADGYAGLKVLQRLRQGG
jgi:membrane-bound lytic murein transglycosylase B